MSRPPIVHAPSSGGRNDGRHEIPQSHLTRISLSLRSPLPDSLDWALSSLLTLSHSRHNTLDLSLLPGLVESLFELIEDWQSDVRLNLASGVMAGVEMELPEELDRERRATDALLVLRNAAFSEGRGNKLAILRAFPRPRSAGGKGSHSKQFGSRFLYAFSQLFSAPPLPQVLELSLRLPEPIIYYLELFYLLLPLICPTLPTDKSTTPETERLHHNTTTTSLLLPLITTRLPALFLHSADYGILTLLMQIIQATPSSSSPPLPLLAPKLFSQLLLTSTNPSYNPALSPSPYDRGLVLFSLDALYELTYPPTPALLLLRDPSIEEYLRALLNLLAWQAQPGEKIIRGAGEKGLRVPLPVGGRVLEQGVAVQEDDGSEFKGEGVGLGPILELERGVKEGIRMMEEPGRCLAWIKATFVAQPGSSMTQVIFWNSYRDFCNAVPPPQSPSSVHSPVPPSQQAPPLLVAADVIKNATSNVPGTQAIVAHAEGGGAAKFLLQGMRFRRSPGKRETYRCKWDQCPVPISSTSPEELITHLQTAHLGSRSASHASRCKWGSCNHPSGTLPHLLTHIPGPIDPSKEAVTQYITIDPQTPVAVLRGGEITKRAPPPLPEGEPLRYEQLVRPRDRREAPVGEAFSACLILRNLARALRAEMDAVEGEEAVGGAVGRRKRKMQEGEAFGLPVPPGYLDNMDGDREGDMIKLTEEERERARRAFRWVVEPRAERIVEDGGGLANYVVDCFGF